MSDYVAIRARCEPELKADVAAWLEHHNQVEMDDMDESTLVRKALREFLKNHPLPSSSPPSETEKSVRAAENLLKRRRKRVSH